MISSLKLLKYRDNVNVYSKEKDNPLCIPSNLLNQKCGFSGTEILNQYLEGNRNLLSTRRILLKEFQKLCKSKVVNYELPLDGERINRIDEIEAEKMYEDLKNNMCNGYEGGRGNVGG
ncbi:hypothetical protein NBO_61g0002 [Nosema bombycis CQ1]|uniref:Uncharacterized protein n=1 Tax=Nosema bombycis (strain CQ1 / CVCC 102059) TaxID=578461 RepID=R0KSI5_NOSB1|nr:hypothetical protein NBO_61g0002 [Nosema bombycis CQ1]|eukprot:EOB13731.1 hypothetical protein NBO_61g0002 [Nosema bombycis CQ1]